MAQRYDVIVAGLGAMGSATAAQLALHGKKVLGLERWVPGHPFGSSHGDSRIIREMYFEHPMYVPLLQRAYELWAVLGERVDTNLLNVHGGLMIGPETGALVTGTLRSAREHGLEHEILSPREVAHRYPAFSLRDDLVAVRDPRAGWLDPEACNTAHLEVAGVNGAELRFEDGLQSWVPEGEGVAVRTLGGDTFVADNLVLCLGARTREHLRDIEIPLEVERQSVFWLDPGDDDAFESPDFPIYAYEYKAGEICYGFPRVARGVKSSIMHSGEIVGRADDVRRDVAETEVEPLRSALMPILPSLSRANIREKGICLFTNTPDHDFVIDFHPQHPQVVVSSACSGHGFKFSSVIGEIQADLVINRKSDFDLAPFAIGRFT